MEALAQTLWLIGSGIVLTLGSLHLLYTLFTRRLYPKNESLVLEMKRVRPVLTNETTMWKAWVGFNCSHSIGAIYFGIANLYLGVFDYYLIISDTFFVILNFSVAFSFCVLGWKYWFRIPLIGMSLCLVCYLASIACFYLAINS